MNGSFVAGVAVGCTLPLVLAAVLGRRARRAAVVPETEPEAHLSRVTVTIDGRQLADYPAVETTAALQGARGWS